MAFAIRTLGPGDDAAVMAAGHLFDETPRPDATRRFLAEPTHHLLIAYDEAGVPAGFVSGVETTHPDKGTEMFLYELGVDEPARRRGVGRALVDALIALARERGCTGMWVGTESDNVAAERTFAAAGGRTMPQMVLLEWDFEAPGG